MIVIQLCQKEYVLVNTLKIQTLKFLNKDLFHMLVNIQNKKTYKNLHYNQQ